MTTTQKVLTAIIIVLIVLAFSFRKKIMDFFSSMAPVAPVNPSAPKEGSPCHNVNNNTDGTIINGVCVANGGGGGGGGNPNQSSRNINPINPASAQSRNGKLLALGINPATPTSALPDVCVAYIACIDTRQNCDSLLTACARAISPK